MTGRGTPQPPPSDSVFALCLAFATCAVGCAGTSNGKGAGSAGGGTTSALPTGGAPGAPGGSGASSDGTDGAVAVTELRPNVAPGGNFELSIWELQEPVGAPGSPQRLAPVPCRVRTAFKRSISSPIQPTER